MALRNIGNHLSCTKRDTGGLSVVKTDQVELTGTSTAPSTSLSDGRVYYNSSGGSLMLRTGSAWKSLGFPKASNRVLTVQNVSTSTVLTTAQSDYLIICNVRTTCTGDKKCSLVLTLPSAATSGIRYHIVNVSSSASQGDLVIASGVTTGGSQQWVAGARGSTTMLNTQYDGITLVSDGSTHFLKVGQSIT